MKIEKSFIPSIEGMRALAIIGVLLYHLDIVFLGGGFLGVDLFFVISGFIISRNIVSELQDKTFSFNNFYVRRFRRLFPALVITLLISLAVAWFIIPPEQLALSSKSSFYSLFSVSNFNFWLESGYFDSAAETKPFLHTWSLGVEEQFYLIWPAVFVLAFRKHALFLLLTSLIVISVGISFYFSQDFPESVFYLLPFRLHQFMMGVFVLLYVTSGGVHKSNALALIAIVGTIFSFLVLDGDVSPAITAVMLSIFGAVLIASRESWLSQVLLGNKAMLWIGKRSYALYLVHWPLIVFWKYWQGFDLQVTDQLVLIVITVVLAMLLHKFIERPFLKRGKDNTWLKRHSIGLATFLLLITSFVSANYWGYDGFPQRVDASINEIVNNVERQRVARTRIIKHGKCNLQKNYKVEDYDIQQCVRLSDKKINILIIGDSHAADTYMLFRRTYRDVHFSHATAGSCPPLLDLPSDTYSTCKALNKLRFEEALKNKFDLIVLAGNWKEERVEPLAATVKQLLANNQKVLVIGPRIHYSESIPLYISRLLSLDYSYSDLSEMADKKDTLLAQMRGSIKGAEIIDMADVQCLPSCEVMQSSKLLYWDAHHWTREGAEFFGHRLKSQFDLYDYIQR